MSIDWNLDVLRITEFPIIQISYTIEEELKNDPSYDTILKSFPLRLFILSHQIANTGIPCIYLKSEPKYLIQKNGDHPNSADLTLMQPTVLVFDLLNKFEIIKSNILPSWANLIEWNWSYQNIPQYLTPNPYFIFSEPRDFHICGFSEEFSDHLQQALTLGLFYHYFSFDPFYFTSFILLSQKSDIDISCYQKDSLCDILYQTAFHPKHFLEPIIVKPVPVYRVKYLTLRWIVESESSFLISPKCPPPIGSYILLQPFRHPLRITTIEYDKKKVTKQTPISSNPNQRALHRIQSVSNIANKAMPIPLPITKGTINRPQSTPFTNTYYIVTSAKITATTIDQNITISFKIPFNNSESTIPFVVIQNPSAALHFFFYKQNQPYKYGQQSIPATKNIPVQPAQPTIKDRQSLFSQFDNSQLSLFSFDLKDYQEYLANISTNDPQSNQPISQDDDHTRYFIDNSKFTPNDIISEQINGHDERSLFRESINNILLQFNSLFTIHNDKPNEDVNFLLDRVELRLPNVPVNYSKCFSFFSFLHFPSFVGYPKTTIKQSWFYSQNHSQQVPYERLGIPNIRVNSNGGPIEVRADTVFDNWQKNIYLPLYGPKKVHFVVFYQVQKFDGIDLRASSSLAHPMIQYQSSSLYGNDHDISNYIDLDSVQSFMSRFQDAYTQLGLGELAPCPREDVFNEIPQNPLKKSSVVNSNDPMNPYQFVTSTVTMKPKSDADDCRNILESIKKVLSSEFRQEFQDMPIVFIIIGKPHSNFFTLNPEDLQTQLTKRFDSLPRIHTLYVNTELVNHASESDFFALSFELYGQIRSYFTPEGMIREEMQKKITLIEIEKQLKYQRHNEFSDRDKKLQELIQNKQKLLLSDFFHDLFFRYRYQPPFSLKRAENEQNGMDIHVAWDCTSKKAVWINDVGDIFHNTEARVLNDITLRIHSILSSSSYSNQLINKITISIFSEYIGDSILEPFKKLRRQVDIYSIFPAPSISAKFEDDLQDDIVIFDELEIINGLHSEKSNLIPVDIPEGHNNELLFELPAQPEASCYVISRNRQAYKVSIYRGGGKERLLEFVRSMSYLSWLSVKPGHENRTSSFPPHMNALMQLNQSPCSFISKFEFFPAF